jgi:hypothetical protein
VTALAERTSAWVVLVLCLFVGIGIALTSVSAWDLADVDAYWEAALRLRAGEPLYPPQDDVNAAEVYRYAPWFAAAWVPLTFLPRDVVEVGWSVVLIGASMALIVATLKARSREAIAVAALLGGFLFLGASFGNVQPLMVAALAFGVERRSGPVWIALAASLKATPLVFVLVYIGRREWRQAAICILLTMLLVLPMLGLGIADYTTEPGFSHSVYASSPIFFACLAAASVTWAAWIAWRRSRWAWLATSVAVMLTLPRFFQYELTYLFVAVIPAVSWLADRWRHETAGRRAIT